MCAQRRCAASTAPARSTARRCRAIWRSPAFRRTARTETFVALKAQIDTWRWAGVPFYLRTGKRLQEQVAEIVITFEDVPHSIFERAHRRRANRLVISLQPRRSITLTILAKNPGETMRLRPVDLRLDMAESVQDAAARCLRAAADRRRQGQSDAVHAPRRTRCRLALDRSDPRGLGAIGRAAQGYTAGSWGPAAASSLIGRGRLCLARRNLTRSCADLRTRRR